MTGERAMAFMGVSRRAGEALYAAFASASLLQAA